LAAKSTGFVPVLFLYKGVAKPVVLPSIKKLKLIFQNGVTYWKISL